MLFTWYGHSCFLLEDNAGTRILTDPCDPSVGYAVANIACDAVTVSHGHHDHSYVEAAIGAPIVIDTAGAHHVGGISVTGFASWHDEAQGAKRGANLLFLYEAEGLRVLHLGDLGHRLPAQTLAEIGQVDVLLCPVGGVYTVDAAEAFAVTQAIDPTVVIPMHYRTPACTIGIHGAEPYLSLAAATYCVERPGASVCEMEQDTLTKKRVLLLDYVK